MMYGAINLGLLSSLLSALLAGTGKQSTLQD